MLLLCFHEQEDHDILGNQISLHSFGGGWGSVLDTKQIVSKTFRSSHVIGAVHSGNKLYHD